MTTVTSCAVFALCVLFSASQPVEKLPVLKQLPSEVLFREHKELVLECATEGKEEGVKYTWQKDGKPFPDQPSQQAKVERKSPNEGTLIFKDPTAAEEGIYKCLAVSALGNAASRPIHVRRAYLEEPAVVTVRQHKPVEGKTYKLDCKIPNAYPKPEISWILKTEKSEGVVQGQRFTISDEGDLYMSNVTKEDTGNNEYICIAKSPAADDVVLAKHVLVDAEPATEVDHEVVQQYVTKDTTLKAGESVYLYCIYGGNPLAHPDWFKDGVDINNNSKDRVTRYNKSVGKRLIIKEVWLEDAGQYSCTVDNEVGKAQKHSFQVKVVSAPQFIKKPEQKIIIKQGEDITIPCHVRAVPEAKVSWTINGSRPSRTQPTTSTQGNVVVSDFIIKNAQKFDQGYYGCTAENEYGVEYVETLLYVQ